MCGVGCEYRRVHCEIRENCRVEIPFDGLTVVERHDVVAGLPSCIMLEHSIVAAVRG